MQGGRARSKPKAHPHLYKREMVMSPLESIKNTPEIWQDTTTSHSQHGAYSNMMEHRFPRQGQSRVDPNKPIQNKQTKNVDGIPRGKMQLHHCTASHLKGQQRPPCVGCSRYHCTSLSTASYHRRPVACARPRQRVATGEQPASHPTIVRLPRSQVNSQRIMVCGNSNSCARIICRLRAGD